MLNQSIIKKISILSLHMNYGGIERSVVSLANMLSKKYKVEIAVCYKLIDNIPYNINNDVTVKYLTDVKPNHAEIHKAKQSRNIFSLIKEFFVAIKVLYNRRKGMVNYIKNSDSDIIISTRDIFNFWCGKYAKNNVIKIAWEHNHFHGNMRYVKKIENSVKNCDYLVLVSKELCNFYADRLSDKKCKSIFIPNSIDFVSDKLASLSNKRLISVGRLSKEKGFIDLLHVFKKLLETDKEWKLDIVGDGLEKQNLLDYVTSNNMVDGVTFHGFQPSDYINRLLLDASIYVMTSFTESFGIVLIEAMSHGVPCIAFDSAEGARDIIQDSKNGFLISDRNYNDMIDKINYLMKNKSKRISMGKMARDSVFKYTSLEVSKKWYSLLEKGDVDE